MRVTKDNLRLCVTFLLFVCFYLQNLVMALKPGEMTHVLSDSDSLNLAEDEASIASANIPTAENP